MLTYDEFQDIRMPRHGETVSEFKRRLSRTPRVDLALLRKVRGAIEDAVQTQYLADMTAWVRSGREQDRPRPNLSKISERNQYDGWNQSDWRVIIDAVRPEDSNPLMEGIIPTIDADAPGNGARERCKTAMCVAGWAVEITAVESNGAIEWLAPLVPGMLGVPRDAKLISATVAPFGESVSTLRESLDVTDHPVLSTHPYVRDHKITIVYRTKDGERAETVVTRKALGAETVARQLLGLTDHEVEELFSGHNSLNEVRAIMTRIEAEELIRIETTESAKKVND